MVALWNRAGIPLEPGRDAELADAIIEGKRNAS